MRADRLPTSRAVMLAAAVFLAHCGGGSSGTAPPPPPPPPPPGPHGLIGHVMIVVQENRTPDNLFHGLAGADTANEGTDSAGNVVPLVPVPLATTYDLGHSHADFEAMYDGGRMDGADLVHCRDPSCPAEPAFAYVDPATVVPYVSLAQTWTFADAMFQTNQGPSFPAHQYLIAGTSAPTASGPLADWRVADNPSSEGPTGCADAPAGQTVPLLDPQGIVSMDVAPCFEHPTLIDLLEAAGIDWRYYAPSGGSIWTAPNAIAHLRNGSAWTKVVLPQTQVLDDIAAGRLAPVTWVIPDKLASDHAFGTDGSGPDWVASIVNAVGTSPYWRDTAILITWDDWGGWYDHVAPPIFRAGEDGFRVPLIVVSPYARQRYVSHVERDFGSLLHFVEEAFALPSLGNDDARSDDLADCFDFTQPPAPFVTVPAFHDAAFFTSRASGVPQGDPDDD